MTKPDTSLETSLTPHQHSESAKAVSDAETSKELSRLEEIAKNARKTFFIILVACAYCFLTIGTAKDVELLGSAKKFDLPIIQVSVPVVWFFAAGPILLVGAYFYFHFYLLDMWRGVARLFHRVGNRERAEEYLYPWILSMSLVRVYGPDGREDKSPSDWLENWTPIFLAWGIVPLTLVAFWVRYLMRHDWIVTSIHCLMLALSIVGGYILHRRAIDILTSGQGGVPHSNRSFPRRILRAMSSMVTLTIVLFLVSLSAINSGSEAYCDQIAGAEGCGPIYSGGRLFAAIGRPPHAQLVKADATGGALHDRDMRHADARGALFESADLSRSDLSWIDLSGAVLNKADLTNAQLTNASLREAKLQEAHLTEARLNGANMQSSDFTGAVLDDASFEGAILLRATLENATGAQTNLTGADLRMATLKAAELPTAKLAGSQLKGAKMERANLSQSVLVGADLTHAELQRAILSDSDLTDARLDSADLSGARLLNGVLTNASLVETELTKAIALKANLHSANGRTAKMSGADLRLAQLAEADLAFSDLTKTLMQGAILEGADLERADLSGANLARSNLDGARLVNATLTEANLTEATLRGTDLTGALDLTQPQLDQACGDAQTILPAELEIRDCSAAIKLDEVKP